MATVAVLGGGAFGTSIASLLADNGYAVRLWCYESEVAKSINTQHENDRYFASHMLSRAIIASPDISWVVAEADVIFEAIPVAHMRHIFSQIHFAAEYSKQWVVLSKGIEQETGSLPVAIMHDCGIALRDIVVLSGPNYARDIFHKVPTVAILAGENNSLVQKVIPILRNGYFHIACSDDMIGLQLVGALKNLLALGVGIARGAGYGENTIAALVTIGMDDIAQIVEFCGGACATVYGFGGFGDIFLTVAGHQSRNTKLGIYIGQGISIDDAIAQIGSEPEGINTISGLQVLLKNVNTSFIGSIAAMVNESRRIDELIGSALSAACK